ncbi:phospho-N-acetylmuramoyl-pentapeptide-transferase [Candidatus Foliamicus sp.]
MLEYLARQLIDWHSGFGVFEYITLRTVLAALTSLVLSLALGPMVIRRLRLSSLAQPVRNDGPSSHFSKIGTPTLGGVPILLALLGSTLLWAELSNGYVWVVLGATVSFGLIGLVDDYRKLSMRTSAGLPSWLKFLLQTVAAILVLVALSAVGEPRDAVLIPYFKDLYLHLGILFPLFAWIVIVGSSNAVNLTDGLDGLAIMPIAIAAATLGLFAWIAGNAIFSDYLGVPYVADAGELMIICASIAGAGLGFLWFNSYPAQVFMGDVGALSLGAALGTVAVVVRQEIAWAILGGIFVMEAVSVMVQVVSFRLTGKRVFRMAPMHHHFELKGWPEPKIIVRFWIISVILALVAVASLKIR